MALVEFDTNTVPASPTNVNGNFNYLDGKIGDLTNLNTTDKTSLVESINEVNSKLVLLWTNSSPTSSFAEQTLTLSSSDYDEILIFYKEVASQDKCYSQRILKGCSTRLFAMFNPSDVYFACYSREVIRNSDTSFTFGSGTYYYAGSNSYGTLNTAMVPIYIYGIKH